MKLTASNLGASASVDKGYGGMFGSGVASLVSAPFVPNDAYSAVLLKNNFREISTSKRHYQPIRVGLAAAWDFSGRFSLESGLTYSYLVSDLSSGTASDRYDIRQTLHYVGVPLDLNFSIWKASGFDLYLSAGVLAEKCVGGNTATSYFLDSKLSEKISEGISEKPWQWSAGASVGVRYDFNKYIGLYAEPGLSYYFDDGSFIESVYSDRPLNFTLSLGLRFSFGR